MRRLIPHQDLVAYLVLRDLRIRYRRSSIGFAWTMLQPLLTMFVLHAVFSRVFRFDIANYPIYALAGIILWNFFSQSVVTSMNSLRANAQLLLKLPVPKFVFPLSSVLAGALNLLFALIPLLLMLLLTGHPMNSALLFLPVSILIATAFTLGAGLLLSPLAAFFHDIIELVTVLLTLGMYLTPVFYPMSIVPTEFLWVVRFNPLRSVLEVFRDPIYLGKVPPWTHLAVACVIAFVSLGLGIYSFRRAGDRIAFYL